MFLIHIETISAEGVIPVGLLDELRALKVMYIEDWANDELARYAWLGARKTMRILIVMYLC